MCDSHYNISELISIKIYHSLFKITFKIYIPLNVSFTNIPFFLHQPVN